MRKLMLLLAVLGCLVGLCGVAQATEYHVGSGQQYATMNALLSAVTLGDNDIAWVHPGTYGAFNVSSGGGSTQATAAQIRAYDTNNKPVFSGGTNTIQVGSLGKWYKLVGLVQTSGTSRGFFHTCGGLIIQNCKVQNTPDGIMSGMCNTRDANPGYLIAEYNELTGNGSGTQYHSWYLQEYWCQIRYNWTHNAAGGIGYKDRSRTSTVEYNLIEPGSSGAGCAVSFCGWDDSEMPDVGQTATMTGNIVTKNGGGNQWLFINNIRMADGGNAGQTSPGYLYLYNNTFYTESHTGPMLADDEVSIIAAHNNIFHTTNCTLMYDQVDGANGPGQVLTSYNNWVKSIISRPAAFTNTVTGTAPGVVNAATSGGDWHLTSGSQCINAGRTGLSVVPNKEYVAPCNYTTRASDGSIDIGAYEYNGGPVAPVANFTGNPTSGYTPLTVAFTDSSTGSPTSWSWNFGDSSTSTSQSPSHQYTSAGSFTVSLRATNAVGYDDEVKTNYITASALPTPPVAAFSGNPTSGNAPLAVTFTDASTNTPTSWSWNFGDSSTSTSQSPSHTYGSAGNYTVSLRATNAGGYDDEVKTNYIAVSASLSPTFVAAGAVASGTGTITPALPAGIASNDILLLFLETANQAISISNQNGGTWTAVTSSPQGTGTAGGSAATCLTAFWSRYNGTQGAPTASDSGNHQLGRIVAVRGCATSGNPWDVTAGGVESTADTSGSIPGATTTVANTLVVAAIATSLPDASGTANFSAWTNANLTSLTEKTDNTVTAGNGGGLGIATGVKSAAGAYGATAVTCATSASKGMMSIALKPTGGGGSAPVANFSGTPTSGTAPLAVSFTDSSTNTPTSWSWNFGDSSTSTSQNPSHTYAAGTYTVSLRATNAYGYDDEVKTNYITASAGGSPPVAAFSGTPTSGTAPLSVSFTDSSTNTPTSWSWNFGDSSTSTSQNPSHSYAAGTYTVSLRATNAYGYDDEVKTNYITATSGGGEVTLFSDHFASGLGNWTVSGSTSMCTCGSDPSIHYARLRCSPDSYIQRTISTSGRSTIKVHFSARMFTGSNSGAYYTASWYDGTTWTELFRISPGDSTWYAKDYTLPSGANNNPNFALKFFIHGTDWHDDAQTDDVIVKGT